MKRLSLLVLVVACQPDAPPATVTIDTLPSGVIHVVNHAPARWADTNGWKLVHEHTITTAVQGPGSIGMIGALDVDREGRVYLFDALDPAILVFGSNGEFEQRIGRDGDGPGEFRVGTFSIVGDTVAVQDAGNSRMVLFATDGTPLGEWPGPFRAPDVLPVRTDGAVATPVWLRDRVQSPQDQYPGRGWVYFALDGTPRDTVRTPPVPETATWRVVNERVNFAITVPFAPDREFALTREGTVVWGDQSAGTLVYSRTGEDTVRITEFPTSAVRVPDALRRDALDEALDKHDWLQGIATLESIPTSHPRWDYLTTQEDHVWIRRVLEDGSHRWMVLDPEGLLLGEVPAAFEPNWRDRWQHERVYHLTTTDDGIPAVEVWRIDRVSR